MIYSLLGQSEVLTASGVWLYLSGHETFGVVLVCLGILGAFGRFGTNMTIVQKHSEGSESEKDENEEIKKVLSEIKRNL